MCLHTIILDPAIPARIFIAISAAGAFRTDDGGNVAADQPRTAVRTHPRPGGRGRPLRAPHRHAPSRPGVLFMQKHWDVMRSDDAGDSWREVSGNLPTDFGFVIDVHAHEPDTVYVVPIKSDSEHYPPEGKLRVYRSRTGGNEWEPLTRGLPQERLLRERAARRHGRRLARFECGVYFGTTGGQVYASPDAGDTGRPSSAIFRRAVRRGPDAAMIRVVLPAHLRIAGARRG
jgi:hypothetical protein